MQTCMMEINDVPRKPVFMPWVFDGSLRYQESRQTPEAISLASRTAKQRLIGDDDDSPPSGLNSFDDI